jgi:hypothetical protein
MNEPLDRLLDNQHGVMIKGNILLRNDTCIMVSPEMYRGQIAPQRRKGAPGTGRWWHPFLRQHRTSGGRIPRPDIAALALYQAIHTPA